MQNHTSTARPAETNPKPYRITQTQRDQRKPTLNHTEPNRTRYKRSETSTDQQKTTQNHASTARPAETNPKPYRTIQTLLQERSRATARQNLRSSFPSAALEPNARDQQTQPWRQQQKSMCLTGRHGLAAFVVMYTPPFLGRHAVVCQCAPCASANMPMRAWRWVRLR
jgi:hypothetical protein